MQEANREGHVLRDSLYRNTQEREMNTERGTCMPVGGWGAGGLHWAQGASGTMTLSRNT